MPYIAVSAPAAVTMRSIGSTRCACAETNHGNRRIAACVAAPYRRQLVPNAESAGAGLRAVLTARESRERSTRKEKTERGAARKPAAHAAQNTNRRTSFGVTSK